jgi:Cu-Zn family superoxide dismutase
LSRAPLGAGALAPLALAACATLTIPAPPGTRATAELRTADGMVIGTALLTEASDGVRVLVEVRALPPGAKAVHVHEVGRCDPPRFTSAGDHFNPGRREHGLQNPRGPHAGDLPNLSVAEDGTGRLEVTTARITLGIGATSVVDGAGRALVIHSGPDDHRTDPTGNSGARIACGVIK